MTKITDATRTIDAKFSTGSHETQRGPEIHAMDHKVPSKIGMRIYLPELGDHSFTYRNKKFYLLGPCNFVITHLTACIQNLLSPLNFASHESRGVAHQAILREGECVLTSRRGSCFSTAAVVNCRKFCRFFMTNFMTFVSMEQRDGNCHKMSHIVIKCRKLS